ncbi:uncharacterized protein LOC129584215 [Paramacrobiotus metropolitanus]|uniref:uncharacterized protein LOC129584215 n=1 Tax=Paramacrobiotus metropolitanus TaxID=2943436 RepID=UPI002445D4C1|nr:uncharacterized protein LOC129584215 [Paramacrobiotus metropolitanus]
MGRSKSSKPTTSTRTTTRAPSSNPENSDGAMQVDEDPIRDYCAFLANILDEVWKVQSDLTREELCIQLRDRFFETFQKDTLTVSQVGDMGNEVWLILCRVVLVEGSLKIKLSGRRPDPVQYRDTMRTIAAFLCDLHRNPELSNDGSRLFVVRIIKFFAKGLESGRWEVRYRILQFINCFLEKMASTGAVFSSIEETDGNKDLVRKYLLTRTFDVKNEVAALAMEAIQHYQYEKEACHTTRAFLVLHCRMQEHESAIVRAAAVRSVHVCSSSAAAIIRSAFDSAWEVRVAAYEVIADAISPKIVKCQLRALLILTGLNHLKSKVRTATQKCLRSWLGLCNRDYNGLMTDANVIAGHPLHSGRQLGFEIFNQEVVGAPSQLAVTAGASASHSGVGSGQVVTNAEPDVS